MIPPLKASDDAHKAIVWLEEFRCSSLPVIDEGHLLGFITENIILEANNIDQQVKEFYLIGSGCYVYPETHFYDILKVAADHQLQMVAVLDHDNTYTGVISIQDILTSFAQTAAVQIPGGILVLALKFNDYSLAEISRHIEENHAKILSALVKEDAHDISKIRLTLKINTGDLSRIVATLERFGYNVIGRYNDSKPETHSRERLDMLFRYLDI